MNPEKRKPRILHAAAALAVAANVSLPTDTKAQGSLERPQQPISGPEIAGTRALKSEESALTSADMLKMRKDNLKRLSGNIADTAIKIPDPKQQIKFLNIQQSLMDDYKNSTIALHPTSKQEVQRLENWAPAALGSLYVKLKEGREGVLKDGSYGIFIDADLQQLHLVQRAAGVLKFIFSTRVTTGADGLEINPGKDSLATAAGLLSIQSVSKDHVVLGEDVSYTKQLVGGEHKFEVEGPTGLKNMYIAPRDYATVGVIAYYVYAGQALHFGPIKSAENPSSHGCTRLYLDVALLLDNYIDIGTPVMIHGSRIKGAPLSEIPPVEKEVRSRRKPGEQWDEDWKNRAFDSR